MMALFCNAGTILLNELNQLRTEKWVPIAVKKPKNQNGPITLLTFDKEETVAEFIKLNKKLKSIPQNWLYGHVYFPPQDEDIIKERGWRIEKYIGPVRFDKKRFQLSVECVDFLSPPNIDERPL